MQPSPRCLTYSTLPTYPTLLYLTLPYLTLPYSTLLSPCLGHFVFDAAIASLFDLLYPTYLSNSTLPYSTLPYTPLV